MRWLSAAGREASTALLMLPLLLAAATTSPAAAAGERGYVVRISASADHHEGAPQMRVFLDDMLIGNVQVTAERKRREHQHFAFEARHPGAARLLRIEFPNDASDEATGRDRNLYLGEVSVNGKRIEPATGIYERYGQPAIPGQGDLYWEGALVLPIPTE